MVTLDLYTVSCDPHTVDKTDYITATSSASGTIRGPLDIQHPVIECEGDLSSYNYAALGGRFYRVDSCNRERTGRSVLSLSTDVLWTFKDQIYGLHAVVDRSYRLVNSYLPDTEQKAVPYTQCVNKNIGISALNLPFAYGSNGHILVTVG